MPRKDPQLFLAGDLHLNDYPKYPDMFGHLQDALRDVVDDAESAGSELVLVGDTLDPLHGSISARVLDPVCLLFKELAARVPITMIKGNHGRGAGGTEDHLETPLGLITGVNMHDDPEVISLGGFVCGLIPYIEEKEEFIDIVKDLSKQLGKSSTPALLFTHQGYRGGYVGPDEPGYRPDEEQGAWNLPVTLFKDWHHVFSGHYHSHQTFHIGSTPVTYVGALLQHNFGDEGRIRGYVKVGVKKGEIHLEHVPHNPRYPIFRRPRITALDIPQLMGEDLSNVYLQPVVMDASVNAKDLQGLQAYKVFPTLWDNFRAGTSRLGEVTAQSSVEEIIASYVEALCSNFPGEVQDRLFATGLNIYGKVEKPVEQAEPGVVRPLEIEFQNFRRAKAGFFDLRENGTAVFVGKNGAGKSTVRYAIAYAIFGTIPGTAESAINRLVGKDCFVRWVFECGSKTYTIIRHRRHVKYKDKILFFEGTEIPPKDSDLWRMGAGNPQTQKKIDALLGIDEDTFDSVICISKIFKLASSSVKDSEKREFLERAFGLEEWELPYQQVLSDIQEQKESLEVTEKEIAGAEAVRDSTQNHLLDLQEKHDNWDRDRRKKIQDLRSETIQLDSRLKKLREREPVALDEAQADLDAKKEALENLPKDGEADRKRYTEHSISILNELSEKKTIKSTTAQRIEEIEREKKTMLPMARLRKDAGEQPCPTCQQPVAPEHIESCQREFLESRDEKLEELRETVNKAISRIKELNDLKAQLDVRLHGIDNNIKRRKGLKDEILFLTEKLQGVREQADREKRVEDNLVRQREQTEKQITAQKGKVSPYGESIEKYKEELRVTDANLQELRSSLQTGKDRLSDLKFWMKGYSKQGVRSYLLDTYLPTLTDFVQKQLDVLSGGSLRINMTPQRQTSDGKIVEEFTVEIINIDGGESYEEQSGGEQHRIDIAVALGVNAYSRSVRRRSVNMLFLDEAADNFLDDPGVQDLAQLIMSFSKDLWFGLITHKPQLAARFDRRTHVVRDEEGFSKYTR